MKDQLKVVHICTYDTGGAAKAMLNLHFELLNQGIDSKVICLQKQDNNIQVYEYSKREKKSLLSRILNKLKIERFAAVRNSNLLKKLDGKFEIYAFPETDLDLTKSEVVKNADIIHLHWISFFLDYKSFFKKINKPIAWTLHDKNPALGGFHLELDSIRNTNFQRLEVELILKKKNYLKICKKIIMISPSQSLLNFSKQSEALNSFLFKWIPNSVNVEIFKPYIKCEALAHFNINSKKKIVLFLNNPVYHKGSDIIAETINEGSFENLFFISLGDHYKINNADVLFVPFIKEDKNLALLYSCADLFLLPSREDNLPNMMLECLACGTPVFGSPVGGIAEVINDLTGRIVKSNNKFYFTELLSSFEKEEILFDRAKISKYAYDNFNPQKQAWETMKVYNELLNWQ